MKGFDSVSNSPGWQAGCEAALKTEAETTARRASRDLQSGRAVPEHGPGAPQPVLRLLVPAAQTRVFPDEARDRQTALTVTPRTQLLGWGGLEPPAPPLLPVLRKWRLGGRHYFIGKRFFCQDVFVN